jgi:hypothetical protein
MKSRALLFAATAMLAVTAGLLLGAAGCAHADTRSDKLLLDTVAVMSAYGVHCESSPHYAAVSSKLKKYGRWIGCYWRYATD